MRPETHHQKRASRAPGRRGASNARAPLLSCAVAMAVVAATGTPEAHAVPIPVSAESPRDGAQPPVGEPGPGADDGASAGSSTLDTSRLSLMGGALLGAPQARGYDDTLIGHGYGGKTQVYGLELALLGRAFASLPFLWLGGAVGLRHRDWVHSEGGAAAGFAPDVRILAELRVGLSARVEAGVRLGAGGGLASVAMNDGASSGFAPRLEAAALLGFGLGGDVRGFFRIGWDYFVVQDLGGAGDLDFGGVAAAVGAEIRL